MRNFPPHGWLIESTSHLFCQCYSDNIIANNIERRGPRVVVSTAAFHARVRGSVSGLVGLKEKMFLPHPRVKVSIVGSLRDREVACSASDRKARISNPVAGGQCHLNHLIILRRFSWPSLAYMCTKPDSFHFIFANNIRVNIWSIYCVCWEEFYKLSYKFLKKYLNIYNMFIVMWLSSPPRGFALWLLTLITLTFEIIINVLPSFFRCI